MTFLVNLMFLRLGKFDGIFGEGGRIYGGDKGLNSGCYFDYIFGGRIFGEEGLTGFYGIH